MGLAVASSPFHLSLCFLVLLCLCSGYPFTAGAMLSGNETDRLALLAFKAEITSNSFGALSSWNKSSHFCQWSGVTCGRRHRRVTVLDLSDQELSGFISPHIGNLSFLREIWLDNNSLSQQIPPELGRLRRLQILSLTNNLITGRIPANISAASRLTEVHLNLNGLEGQIPEELGSLSKLKFLRVGKNSLTGVVPRTLGNLSSLQTFNAPYNSIGGNLPDELGRLTSLTSFGMGSNRFRRRTRVPSFGIMDTTFQNVSYQSLRQATGGFSQANLIGVGGFGSVYKGVLDQGGQVIAVKVLNLQFRGASKSFVAECKALKNMKHRNLVKVLTVCSGIDYHGNDFKALVYEFMVNGSLDEWLHPQENEYAANEDSRQLNLQQRLDIAIDVASALDYIHNHCPEPIVHCDLKPTNVLLDEDMIAHVGDFGLAKFFPKAIFNSSQSHDLSSSIGIRGSIGYAAPEYGMGNEVSTSGDVFTYGILLLELFTGKRPTDDMFSDNLSLHNFVKKNFPEQIEGIADPRLFKQREEVEASSSDPAIQFHSFSSGQRNLECLISLLKIGIACSEELPRDRMAISDVVAQLHAIRNIHFRAGGRHGGRRDGRQLGHE